MLFIASLAGLAVLIVAITHAALVVRQSLKDAVKQKIARKPHEKGAVEDKPEGLSADFSALIHAITKESEANRNEEKREDDLKQVREWLTIALLVSTVVLLGWQVSEMVKVYGPIRDQADAAETMLNGTQRPHLVVTDIKGAFRYTCRSRYDNIPNQTACPTLPPDQWVPGQSAPPAPLVNYLITFTIHNFGQTPARLIDGAINTCPLEHLPASPVYYKDNSFFNEKNIWIERDKGFDDSRIATVQNSEANNYRVEHPQAPQVAGKGLYFFLWGVLEYEDVTGRIIQRRFALKFPYAYNGGAYTQGGNYTQEGGEVYNQEFVEKSAADALSLPNFFDLKERHQLPTELSYCD